MSQDLKRLRERMSGLSDAELLRIVNVEYRDYRPEALEIVRAELDSRGLAYGGPGQVRQSAGGQSPNPDNPDNEDSYDSDDDEDDDGESEREDAEFKPSFCIACGAETRRGYLFAGRGEMTVVFSDNNEERFIELDACQKCGNVRLVVDFETDVAD